MLSELINASAIVLSAIILLIAQHYTFKKLLTTKQWKYWQCFIIKAFNQPIKVVIVLICIIYLVEFFYLSKHSFFTNENFETATLLVLVTGLTWGTLAFIKRLEKYFLKSNSLSNHNEKARHRSTIIFLMKLCFVTTFVSGILILLHTLGVRMQAIITVISLSGVAIGISSRDLVASFFGTIFIYTNRPFSIGDRIKINGFEGVVENITWLSTRLRLDNKNLTYIPNIQFLNATVENVSYALERRITVLLTLFHNDFRLINIVIQEILDSIRQFEIAFEEHKYNPRVSGELVEMSENKVNFKVQLYFDKYITKDALALQKIKISQLVINKITNSNMRFNLKTDD